MLLCFAIADSVVNFLVASPRTPNRASLSEAQLRTDKSDV